MDVYREHIVAAKTARRMMRMDWVARRAVFEKCLAGSSRRFCMTLGRLGLLRRRGGPAVEEEEADAHHGLLHPATRMSGCGADAD